MNDDQTMTDALGHLPGDDPAEDILRSMRALMPAKSRNTMEILERVKKVYVASGRDLVLRQQFNTFLELILSERAGRRDPGSIFFVTGPSGAGKTEAVRYMVGNHPSMGTRQTGFGLVRPWISVSLKGFTHPRIVGRNILAEAGYPIRQDAARGEIWDGLADRLKTRGVLIVHIDETQHMIKKTSSPAEREKLGDAIKGLTNHEDWPVSLILSGLPSTNVLAQLDQQFERRGFFVALPDVNVATERTIVLEIVRQMADAAELALGTLFKEDVPERLAHVARYRYARICQVTLAAIHAAVHRGADTLAREHFALAYQNHSHARGFDSMNAFLVDDWRDLPAGSFLLDDAADEEDMR